MYNWITLLDTRKSYNTVNKLYFNKKGKMYNITMYILYIYIYIYIYMHIHIFTDRTSPAAPMVKNLSTVQETRFNSWARKIPWRRKWQPTQIFLPGEFHGQRSLTGYSSWGHKQSNMTGWLTQHIFIYTYIHLCVCVCVWCVYCIIIFLNPDGPTLLGCKSAWYLIVKGRLAT